jgi:hypothetical protein
MKQLVINYRGKFTQEIIDEITLENQKYHKDAILQFFGSGESNDEILLTTKWSYPESITTILSADSPKVLPIRKYDVLSFFTEMVGSVYTDYINNDIMIMLKSPPVTNMVAPLIFWDTSKIKVEKQIELDLFNSYIPVHIPEPYCICL